MNYTLEDLENAKSVLRELKDRFDRYTGNNPDKFQADIRVARRQVEEIERSLKDSGVLPLTEAEKLDRTLDRAFPNAQSRESVEHNGRQYQLKYYPVEKSRSGKTVTKWGRKWTDLADKHS